MEECRVIWIIMMLLSTKSSCMFYNRIKVNKIN